MRKYSSRDIHILEIVRFDWTGGGALLGGYGNYMIRLASLFSVVCIIIGWGKKRYEKVNWIKDVKRWLPFVLPCKNLTIFHAVVSCFFPFIISTAVLSIIDTYP